MKSATTSTERPRALRATTSRGWFAATFFLLFVTSIAAAGSDAHLNARFFGGSASDRAACQRLVNGPAPSTFVDRTAAAQQVSVCLELARNALSSATDEELLETYRAIQVLEPWVAGNRPLVGQWTDVESEALSRLDARGLLGGTYTAVLQGQLVRADPGGYVGEPSNAPDQGRTSAAVALAVETEHMALGRSWDFSLMFAAAAQPLFVMVRTPSGDVTPAFVSGTATSTGFRFARASESTETAVVGNIGGTRLNADVATFGGGTESVVVAANDINQWALFMEGSVDFRWYPRDVWLIHLETQPLEPLFHIFVGLKHDQRFHRSGDLQNYNDPTGRVFFGFDVDPIHVPNGRAGSSSLLTIGAGFKFEGALRLTDRLPSDYQVALSANLDVLKTLRYLRK